MNILYLSHRLPYPPNKGEKIRVFNHLRQLSKNHRLSLCSFADGDGDLSQTLSLKEWCTSVEVVHRTQAVKIFLATAAFLQRQPLSVRLFYKKALVELVRRKLAAERFDCVVVSCSSMAQYVSGLPGVPRVIDFIDVDSEKWRDYARQASFPLSLLYRREAELLARYEEKLTRGFNHSIVSSEAEARVLRRQVNDRPITAITNGVDLEYFSSSSKVAHNGRPIIVFTGAMDYFPNIDAVQYFCQEVLPLVRREVPAAEFYIVGRSPTRQVKVLARQANVVVTGTVTDVRPYLDQAKVAVASFRIARGVQNKILEAMAMGVPVVGTAETFKGIRATEADGTRVADDPATFARHVIAFLRADPDSRRRVAVLARSYVERHHRWEDQGEKLERILIDVVGRNRGAKISEVQSVAVA